ncbi:mannitol dehydrogenase family protein [Leptolyngbya sp. FACHB-17]|uniref:mannitol dehydrogenase family protein n=1 Tax=unclassified Leptolyngbya TaxID=2650499 RepID=UPI001681450D|nr:mannitol dehydrogenase family protein [Leptolyngbya sp. FACHB-17]MBD2081712.1 mannitol dehydrogenase family protein [Leptolyngbya sp. FACHB-17]
MSQTHSATKLNQAALSRLSKTIRVPQYDRYLLKNGIVHIGVGGFHRAHQALYVDNYFHQTSDFRWGICGIGLLQQDRRMRDALQSQDHLYTLVERSPNHDRARIIGAIDRYLFAPEDPQSVIAAMASPDCRIVTLTITEGGYYYNEASGELEINHPTIQHDLQQPEQPIGTYGFLTAALNQRREQGLAPFTVQSCDNLQGNGNITRKMLTTFAELHDPALGQWLSEHGAFPNSMVDRITPATTDSDRALVADQFGLIDDFPVMAEPFLQWVIEDQFCAGRPELETVGVQFTTNVHSYELIKIRLLNASHLLIGYLGTLLGYTYVHEVMADVQCRNAVMAFMEEVTPTLQPVPGLGLTDYKRTLIERFENPKIRDRVSRLCSSSSVKVPKFLLGSLRDLLQQQGEIKYLSFTIAAWFYCLMGQDDQGQAITIEDPLSTVLTARVNKADVRPLLSLSEIFGDDLVQSLRFVEAIERALRQLSKTGVRAALSQSH